MKEAAAAYEAGTQYFLNLARAITPDLMDVHAENEWSARQCICLLYTSPSPRDS